jgi:hypothetical protein
MRWHLALLLSLVSLSILAAAAPAAENRAIDRITFGGVTPLGVQISARTMIIADRDSTDISSRVVLRVNGVPVDSVVLPVVYTKDGGGGGCSGGGTGCSGDCGRNGQGAFLYCAYWKYACRCANDVTLPFTAHLNQGDLVTARIEPAAGGIPETDTSDDELTACYGTVPGLGPWSAAAVAGLMALASMGALARRRRPASR